MSRQKGIACARPNRQSIRLKGHDYAGGGTYFVTICAHRDFIAVHHGAPFTGPLREMLTEEWQRSAELRPYVHLDAFVVMPDHFHALLRLDAGRAPLGEVVGAFKGAVSRRWRRAGAMHGAPERAGAMHGAPTTLWHRNYYDRIIRDPTHLENTRAYIRTNPWKNIVHLHNGMRGIGNPALWSMRKIGLLCSRDCPADTLAAAVQRARRTRQAHCLLSGFHSPPERTLLTTLLAGQARIICCPAWGIETMRIPADWLPALRQNRMLILQMGDTAADRAAARARNAFVLAAADELWLPHVSPNGMLARLLEALHARGV